MNLKKRLKKEKPIGQVSDVTAANVDGVAQRAKSTKHDGHQYKKKGSGATGLP